MKNLTLVIFTKFGYPRVDGGKSDSHIINFLSFCEFSAIFVSISVSSLNQFLHGRIFSFSRKGDYVPTLSLCWLHVILDTFK